ncbi:MAG: MFS transporter, partial [Rhodospirillales bacterium]|nr:MFS transporter [Rhodospirillales bacterium]
MTEQTTKRRDERKILSLICAGHFYSHFYTLVLPPLFPLIILDMGLSYVALGSVLTAFAIVSGSCQYPMGILVDRYGPRRFIIGGLIFYSCAIGLMSLADSYWVLVLLAMFAGLGNSTFHPSDYAVLGERIAP